MTQDLSFLSEITVTRRLCTAQVSPGQATLSMDTSSSSGTTHSYGAQFPRAVARRATPKRLGLD